MVRVRRANFENWREVLLPEEGLYVHDQPTHPSYQGLLAEGKSVVGLEAEIPDGSILVLTPRPLDELRYVMDRLLGPGGCPWDQEQTHESLKRCLLEETYEVLEAIDRGDLNHLREELGDLILQPVMHAQIEALQGNFDVDDVARELVDKLVRRHPHVFGNLSVADSEEVLKNWDAIKRQEKHERTSILDGIPHASPSLLRAHQVSRKAAKAGFEWPDLKGVFDKLDEERAELEEAIASGDVSHMESELGDLLFTVVNIARWLKVEPEDALRRMLDRFEARFRAMERLADVPLAELSLDEWDRLWNEAKRSAG